MFSITENIFQSSALSFFIVVTIMPPPPICAGNIMFSGCPSVCEYVISSVDFYISWEDGGVLMKLITTIQRQLQMKPVTRLARDDRKSPVNTVAPEII